MKEDRNDKAPPLVRCWVVQRSVRMVVRDTTESADLLQGALRSIASDIGAWKVKYLRRVLDVGKVLHARVVPSTH